MFINKPKEKKIKNALIIVNPNSGGRKGLKNQLLCEKIFKENDINYETIQTTHAGHALEICRDYKDLNKFDVICPIGGDGTLHESINGFMTRDDDISKNDIIFGIIPGGSGNTVAHDLGITSIEDGINKVIAGNYQECDVMELTPYLNNTNITTEITTDINQKQSDNKNTDSNNTKNVVNKIYSINIVGYGLPVDVLNTVDSLRSVFGGAYYNFAALLKIMQNKKNIVDITYINEKDEKIELKDGKYGLIQAQITKSMGDKVPFCPDAKL